MENTKLGNYDTELTINSGQSNTYNVKSKDGLSQRMITLSRKKENYPIVVEGRIGDINVYEKIENQAQAEEWINILHTRPPFEN